MAPEDASNDTCPDCEFAALNPNRAARYPHLRGRMVGPYTVPTHPSHSRTGTPEVVEEHEVDRHRTHVRAMRKTPSDVRIPTKKGGLAGWHAKDGPDTRMAVLEEHIATEPCHHRMVKGHYAYRNGERYHVDEHDTTICGYGTVIRKLVAEHNKSAVPEVRAATAHDIERLENRHAAGLI